MDLGRDVRRLFGRDKAVQASAETAALELLPLLALKRAAASAGLAATQSVKASRSERLVHYAALLSEIARRTGEPAMLTRAASAAARAVRETEGPLQLASRLEQVGAARLSAELFADPEGVESAADFLTQAERLPGRPTELEARRSGLRAAVEASQALAAADLDWAERAASGLDAAIARVDQLSRQGFDHGVQSAALHLDRADFLIALGVRLKDKALLTRAEADLAETAARLDRAYAPLSWARVEALRGAALAAIGDLSGDPQLLTRAVRALAAAAEQVDADHSPLDRARISHALALTLSSLAEAIDDEGLYDHAVAAFDQALAMVEENRALALRSQIAYDRAACIARRAERRGDVRALDRAEAAFRAELLGRNAAADPVGWAVIQLAIGRVYAARAHMEQKRPPEGATIALAEALDVFTERGLRTLAEAAHDGLARLKDARD